MEQFQAIRFSPAQNEFFTTVTKRVNDYFNERKISKNANGFMVFKTIFMLSLYLVPYALIITSVVTNIWTMFALTIIMGLGIAGIGLSIMHDANHGAYAKKKWINNFIGYSLNLIGGNALNWKIQHNVLHHTYTNIHDVDEDISPRGILRMAPASQWRRFHRYQYLYAWIMYGLMTIVWVIAKDFARLNKYNRDGLIKRQKTSLAKEWLILLASKSLYIGYIFVLPVLILPIAWWQVFVGILIMHYIAGFILAIIFQPAHVNLETSFPLPDEHGNVENNWAIHQLHTTTNFANKNRLLSWYVGGLNFQIEHHLFPHICHVHYRQIAPIVQATAEEFNLPYYSEPSFLQALVNHGKLLKRLGEKPNFVEDHKTMVAA